MDMRQRLLSSIGVLALMLAVAAPAPAPAQDPQVDPDSPAGTEYQLPTDRARQDASSPAGKRSAATSGAAPLFGEGVGEKKRSGAKSGTDSDPATAAQVEPDDATGTAAVVRAQAPAPDGGGGGVLAIGAIAAAVLLVGGLAGLAWRRRTVRR